MGKRSVSGEALQVYWSRAGCCVVAIDGAATVATARHHVLLGAVADVVVVGEAVVAGGAVLAEFVGLDDRHAVKHGLIRDHLERQQLAVLSGEEIPLRKDWN